MNTDEKHMRAALEEALSAKEADEVPVGAVIVRSGRVIARAHNLKEQLKDPTAHAELLAIREASKELGSWRLEGCTLYVTLEPCPMCTGAAINARLERIVFGAFDERTGCCVSVADMPDGWFNHSCEIFGGILERECAALLSDYFKGKRD